MVKGLYTAYSGLTVQQKRLDVVSNNLANATTTGYKKEGLTTQSFKDVYGIKVKDETVGYINQNIGTLNLGAKVGESSEAGIRALSRTRFIPGTDLSR